MNPSLLTERIDLLKQDVLNLIAERDVLRTALGALLSTAIRHRWKTNSDEPDTIGEAVIALDTTRDLSRDAGPALNPKQDIVGTLSATLTDIVGCLTQSGPADYKRDCYQALCIARTALAALNPNRDSEVKPATYPKGRWTGEWLH